MFKKIKEIFNLKFISGNKLSEIRDQAIDDALTAYRDAHNDIFSEESIDEYISGIQGENNQKQFKDTINGIKNPALKDVLNYSFSHFPNSDLSQEEIWLLQDAAREKYNMDPIWSGAVDSFIDYILGTGITVSSPVKEINVVLNDFRRRNKMHLRERNLVKSLFLDGEFFALLFEDIRNGDIYLRKGAPKTITSIHTISTDNEAVLWFKREYSEFDGVNSKGFHSEFIKAIDFDRYKNSGIYKTSDFILKEDRLSKELKNVVCKFIKLGEEGDLRGLPPARSVLKFLKMYENFILDRMTLNHERAKVVWKKKITGRDDNANVRNRRVPRHGTMLIETDQISYSIEKPNLESSEAKEDALALLYYIGSGIRYPLHILNQRTDQSVYASIKTAETPFTAMIIGFQWFLSNEMEEIYKHQIISKIGKKGGLKKEYTYPSYSDESVLMALDAGKTALEKERPYKEILNEITETLNAGMEKITVKTEDIVISQDFPQILQQDQKVVAEVLKMHNEMGIVAKSTLASKAGYDYAKEIAKKIVEKPIIDKLSKSLKPDPVSTPKVIIKEKKIK